MRRRGSAALLGGALALALAATAPPAAAKEVDQFTDREFQLAHLRDASAVVDAQMTVILDRVAARLTAAHARTPAERDRVVDASFQSGPAELFAQLETPFEYWVRDHADVDLYWVDERGVYGGTIDYDDMGFGWYVEIAPVIRLGTVLVGIDKIGHFLTQGWFYYTHAEAIARRDPTISPHELQQRVLAYGHEQESSFLGMTGTGVYSYADLAANWQGYQFYRALFAGPQPYFAQDAAGRYARVRPFHFADWVVDDWDEVVNPSRPRTDQMFAKVARHVRAVACAAYRAAPAAFLHATGRALSRDAYVWEGAGEDAFACKHRFALSEICE